MREVRLLIFIFGCFCFLGGCIFTLDVLELATPEGPPDANEAYLGYYQTHLKTSTSSDVISLIHLPEYELLSQSTSVIASAGQKKKKGYKTWLKMVAFDDNSLTAKRKYLFIEDERPKKLFVKPWECAKFDCEMVLEREKLDKPYSNDNARQIAILRQVLENFRSDIREVRVDNETIDVLGMMANQAFETVLVKLEASPALAGKLGEDKGLEFSHINLDKGKIRMVVEDDIAVIMIRLGSCAKQLIGGDL